MHPSILMKLLTHSGSAVLAASISMVLCHASHADVGQMDFNRDIRPILSTHCTGCHGGVKAAGGISFVYREKALAEGKSGEIAIIPGKSEDSELIKRVTSTDPDEIMPKPEHGPRLSDHEIEKLRAWISQGANWSELWSFVPPKEQPLPQLQRTGWAKSRLDEWVLARLEREKLAPSSEAPPQEWLRRVSLDLSGVPPTLEEFDAFISDLKKDPASAKAKVVDRLLASPRFGERWAAMWLDLARYADTFGFEKDPNRNIWPWRDWVIRAFNADLPFDKFTIKQLAGDLLPEPTLDDYLATSFHRNSQNNTEGGTDDEEYRVVAVLDRVNTTWTAWQATTFGCTQCHAHPYDPFHHKDYYRFASFFNNTEDNDLNDEFPTLLIPEDPSKHAAMIRMYQEKVAARTQLNDLGVATEKKMTSPWKAWIPVALASSGGSLALGENGRVDASGTLPIGVNYTLQMPATEGLTAIRLQILPDSEDPQKWPERGSVLTHLKLALKKPGKEPAPVALKEVIADYLAGPYDPNETLNPGAAGFGGYPVLTEPRWCIVVLNAPLQDTEGATVEVEMHQQGASNSNFQGTPIRHFTWSQTTEACWTELIQSPDRQALWKKKHSLAAEIGKFAGTKVPVLFERPDHGLRANRVFIRGNRLTPGENVEPGIPEISRPPAKQSGLTRLDMATWLVGKENTLTARVLANRLWAELFGRGIVNTLEDFGTSGSSPTHPELLDHLALKLQNDFRWSIKSFLRYLTLSATYAQTNLSSKDLVERDPQNALLARGPRSRLTAEMVRDQALLVSGSLSAKMFGPPVFPPQPEGVWASPYSGARWQTSTGEDRFRRAIYTFVKRTSGYPGQLIFDAPTRDVCSARRISTNTPLQALMTLNDPAFLELAQGLVKRMTEPGGEVRDQIELGCRLITLAPPPAPVVDALVKLHRKATTQSDSSPEKAMLLVANTILNMDAALNR